MTAWRFENAAFGFSSHPFSLSGKAGEILALVGPNGAGKTSLLRALLGERVLTAGAAYLADDTLPCVRLPSTALAERIGYLPQDAPVPPDLTVEALVRIGWTGLLRPWEQPSPTQQQHFQQLIETLGLRSKLTRSVLRLSMGERQRAALARVLLPEPRVLLLDEPTNHLDPPGSSFLWNFLKEKAKAGTAVIISTHDVTAARKHATRIVGVRSGTVVCDGKSFSAADYRTTFAMEEI